VSKAADISSIDMSAVLPPSIAERMSDSTFVRAVSVEWNFRYADWNSGNKQLESM
jgi:hypothetical protein